MAAKEEEEAGYLKRSVLVVLLWLLVGEIVRKGRAKALLFLISHNRRTSFRHSVNLTGPLFLPQVPLPSPAAAGDFAGIGGGLEAMMEAGEVGSG